jgi:hypothetical protein
MVYEFCGACRAAQVLIVIAAVVVAIWISRATSS